MSRECLPTSVVFRLLAHTPKKKEEEKLLKNSSAMIEQGTSFYFFFFDSHFIFTWRFSYKFLRVVFFFVFLVLFWWWWGTSSIGSSNYTTVVVYEYSIPLDIVDCTDVTHVEMKRTSYTIPNELGRKSTIQQTLAPSCSK